ncbi:MAG: L-aspartate oxidase [Ktedonobacterales bacterium]
MPDGNGVIPPATRLDTLNSLTCDVAIIGGGIAGLSVALALPPALRVVLVTKGALGESNTRYAQGGLAAAVGLDDTPDLHLRDTLAAGAGLVDEEAARVLVTEARDAVAWLIGLGATFDQRDPASGATAAASPTDLATRYQLGREAAHSRWRVLHAHGDATGAEIERALVAAVRARPGMRILDSALALRLFVEERVCVGVEVLAGGERRRVHAQCGVVLANGGAGQLWLRTSNPAGATADGLALAWGAGAVLADLEFAQFHPTVLVPPDTAAEPFLISEAVRGEGAYLRNAAGDRFMPRYSPDAELAPRDVVARAILSEMLAGGTSSAFLDLRHLPAEKMRARFPTIAATCRRYGLDLARDLIPVAPAAHYFMGGVAVDTWARTTVPGLYAVGEAACTGVHGANRLASNSLLEGLVFGRRAASAIAGDVSESEPSFNAESAELEREDAEKSGDALGAHVKQSSKQSSLRALPHFSASSALKSPSHSASWPCEPRLPGDALDARAIMVPAFQPNAPIAETIRAALRRVMWEHVSLRRDADGLAAALDELRALTTTEPLDPETANMLFAAQAIIVAALARRESRGGHFREDYPARDPLRDGRHTLLSATGSHTVTEGVLAHAGA